MTEHLPKIGRMFAADTKDHQLTILLDQGEHRHLRAHTVDAETGRPRHLHSVNLVTWPGRVAVSGDMNGFTFRADLPTLRSATQGDISWSYLAEKVDAGADNTRGFSTEAFHEALWEQVTQALTDDTAPEGLPSEAANQFIGDDAETFHTEEDARAAARDFEHDGWEFYDIDEWDLTSYTSDFERAALGLQLVIRLYDRHLASLTARTADDRTLLREGFGRQRLVDEYRGGWVINPATTPHIPVDRCPLCGTTTADLDEWAGHMADHGTEAFSWLKRWQETHPDAA